MRRRWYTRATIAVRRATGFVPRRKRTVRVVVGAGGKGDPGWELTEQSQLNLLREGHWHRYTRTRRIEAVLAEHVWEHLTLDEGRAAARNLYRFLEPGGYVRVAVPDGLHPDPEYIAHVQPPFNGVGYPSHRVLYTAPLLREVFESAGFDVTLLEHWDEHGVFNQAPWSPEQGSIGRSRAGDARNEGGALVYTSIILDAHKRRA